MSLTFNHKWEALEEQDRLESRGSVVSIEKKNGKYIVTESKCNHSWDKLGTSGNPYEGGSVYFKCSKCGMVKSNSEDGVSYHGVNYKPYYRTIADDLRSAGINPETASDETIERFLGSNR